MKKYDVLSVRTTGRKKTEALKNREMDAEEVKCVVWDDHCKFIVKPMLYNL